MSTGNASYAVDTGAMRKTSAVLRDNLRKIKSAVQELRGYSVRMQALWEGEAANEYCEAFDDFLTGVSEIHMLYAQLPDDLDRYATGYERAHGINVTIAAEIEKPQWVM